MFLYELLCIRFLVYLSVCLCLSTCLHVCCNCLYSYLSIYLYLSVCLPDVCIHLSAYLASYRNNSLPVYLAVSSIIYPIWFDLKTAFVFGPLETIDLDKFFIFIYSVLFSSSSHANKSTVRYFFCTWKLFYILRFSLFVWF